ncbi:MAG: hypothetical protein IT518_15560 [Burkholderiales bacterium]|nr:hypothetical protein [Burkholderiales bacterium]
MLFDPRVQVKAIEGEPLLPDWNDDQPRANVAVEHPASDPAVGWGVAIADQPRLQRDGHSESRIAIKTSITQRWSYEVRGVTRVFSSQQTTFTKDSMPQPSIAESVRGGQHHQAGTKRSAAPLQAIATTEVVSEAALMHDAPVNGVVQRSPV